MRRDQRGTNDGKRRRDRTLAEQLVEQFPGIYPPPNKTHEVEPLAEVRPRKRGRPRLRSSHTKLARIYAKCRAESPIEVAARLRRRAEELCRQAMGSVFTTRGWLLAACPR